MKKIIQTDHAPQAIGPYSQAIQFNSTVYFSGQIPLDPKTMLIVDDDFAKQAQQVMLNLQAVSHAAGGSLDQIVRLTIYLTDLADFSVLNNMMTQFFKPPYPARTTIQVAALPKSAKIEIDAVMCI